MFFVLVGNVMSYVRLAAIVAEAMPEDVPRDVCALVADYATMFSAGDWCLMQRPDVAGYKIGVITHVVQHSYGVVTAVAVHECGREVADARR